MQALTSCSGLQHSPHACSRTTAAVSGSLPANWSPSRRPRRRAYHHIRARHVACLAASDPDEPTAETQTSGQASGDTEQPASDVTYSPPKFLFDDDPPAPSSGAVPDLLADNPALASALQGAFASPGVVHTPAPPPPQPEAEPEEVQQVSGPKFLFDDLPEPTSGGGGQDLLGGNPAFAAVLKQAFQRQRGPADQPEPAPAPLEGRDAAAQGGGGSSLPPQDAASPPPTALQQPVERQAAEQPAPAAAQPKRQPRLPPDAAPPPLQEDRIMSASEEVLLSALRDSRRTVVTLQRLQAEVGDAIKREERQFERLHFALKKAQRDAAYLATLEKMLAGRKGADA